MLPRTISTLTFSIPRLFYYPRKYFSVFFFAIRKLRTSLIFVLTYVDKHKRYLFTGFFSPFLFSRYTPAPITATKTYRLLLPANGYRFPSAEIRPTSTGEAVRKRNGRNQTPPPSQRPPAAEKGRNVIYDFVYRCLRLMIRSGPTVYFVRRATER